MDYFGETVLFERSGARVTTRFFTTPGGVRYELSKFRSAGKSRSTPTLVDWTLAIPAIGLALPLMSMCFFLQWAIGMPSAPDAEDAPVGPALYWPVGPAPHWDWSIVLVGIGVAAAGTGLWAILRLIFGRATVGVETKHDEWQIIFASRDAALVDLIVKAINCAIAREAEQADTPPAPSS